MFLRMLKKDLKDSKGLNFIILLFMVIVSTLAAAGALLLFVNSRGVQVSRERCNSSDCTLVYIPYEDEIGCEPQRVIQDLRDYMPDVRIAWQDCIAFDNTNVDFDGKDMTVLHKMNSRRLYLSAQPTEMDLAYDEKDRPFYLENGQVAVTRQFARTTGIKTGDSFFITSQMGRQYAFTVAVIAKDPTKEFQTRIFLSDPDYAALCEECPYRRTFVYMQDASLHSEGGLSGTDALYTLADYLLKDTVIKERLSDITADCHIISNNALISTLMALFIVIAAFFMLVIIFFTLRFTIRSVIKKEERELGIMRALGTDSFSFRWLFAAKYIAFAIVGGIIGSFTGILSGKYLMNNFFYNLTYTLAASDMLHAVLAAALITVLVIVFIFITLKRIDRISVMEVISGETRSESIRHTNFFHLTKQKRMSVPLFLALSDLLVKFRRYFLLLIAFTAGSLLVVFSIQLRKTVISKEFVHTYYTREEVDFDLDLSRELLREMSNNTNRIEMAERNINKRLEEHGIPADIDIARLSIANLITENGNAGVTLNFDLEPARLKILEGQPPKLRSEIMIDRFTADNFGFEIGDTVHIRYNKYTDDRLSAVETEEDFIITGFVDRLTAFNSTDVIMSAEFDSAESTGSIMCGCRIQAPESEKAEYVRQIAELFPGNVIEPDKIAETFLAEYALLFSFVQNSMIIIVLFVLAFMTLMYQSIYMKDEEHETAMLKSCGFDDSAVKKWQFFRMMLLFAASQVLVVVLLPTVVTWGSTEGLRKIVGLTSWHFSSCVGACALWIAGLTAVIAGVEFIVLKGIEKIEIWRIRNE